MTFAFVVDSVPFDKAVIAGTASLGGSESACVGLARGLAARGHQVQIFATKIQPDAVGMDHGGVTWRHLDDFWRLNTYSEWDVVVGLRVFSLFAQARINGRLRILWNEDLLMDGGMKHGVMASAWQVDRFAYVSEFHRKQWESILPEVTPLGWVTRNGFDLGLVPEGVAKDPNRIIHISRPERGLRPLLNMWPRFRELVPEATLRICRYSSMYDSQGWGEVCKTYDAEVQRLAESVGGISYLGELGKPALYREITEAAVMWYPGVSDFAETSCIAAIESQACGTPFVGSYKGALPETAAPAWRAGHLIKGDADRDPAYHEASMAAVQSLLDGCRRSTRAYRELVIAGMAHVTGLSYDALAAEWEDQIVAWFDARYQARPDAVLRQLLQEDDHVAAKVVADQLGDQPTVAFCDFVIAGKDQTADDYGAASLDDPIKESKETSRFQVVAEHLEGVTRLLDVACGNGAFALALAAAHPDVHVVGLDYAASNIAKARAAADTLGFSDRLSFQQMTVFDFDTQQLTPEWHAFADENQAGFDALFVGEFLEHCGNTSAIVDGLEAPLLNGAKVVYTVPNGPLTELMGRNKPIHRGHVHRFADDDLIAIFGPKANFDAGCIPWGITARGHAVGSWLIGYTKQAGRPCGQRPLGDRIVRTRPMNRLSVGIIAKDAEADLARCLTSVWAIADEIVIGDTGSTDRTKAIAAEFGARVIDLPAVDELPGGFSEARNRVLDACTGEWFLWIDTDEILTNYEELRKYIECAGPYRGFVIHQNHVSLDLPTHFDRPVRVFQRDGKIRFFGCVHEQPGDGDPNTDITPCLELVDVNIIHTGYLTETVRKQKMFQRNLPLLVRDRQQFPERRLGLVLVLRDYVNIADQDRDRHNGELTPLARAAYKQAITIFDLMADPADKHHDLARPWYERALQGLGEGYEVHIALAGKRGGMGRTQAAPTKAWVRSAAEFRRLVDARMEDIRHKMEPTMPIVEPFEDVLREAVSA